MGERAHEEEVTDRWTRREGERETHTERGRDREGGREGGRERQGGREREEANQNTSPIETHGMMHLLVLDTNTVLNAGCSTWCNSQQPRW